MAVKHACIFSSLSLSDRMVSSTFLCHSCAVACGKFSHVVHWFPIWKYSLTVFHSPFAAGVVLLLCVVPLPSCVILTITLSAAVRIPGFPGSGEDRPELPSWFVPLPMAAGHAFSLSSLSITCVHGLTGSWLLPAFLPLLHCLSAWLPCHTAFGLACHSCIVPAATEAVLCAMACHVCSHLMCGIILVGLYLPCTCITISQALLGFHCILKIRQWQ